MGEFRKHLALCAQAGEVGYRLLKKGRLLYCACTVEVWAEQVERVEKFCETFLQQIAQEKRENAIWRTSYAYRLALFRQTQAEETPPTTEFGCSG